MAAFARFAGLRPIEVAHVILVLPTVGGDGRRMNFINRSVSKPSWQIP